jgi:hypothetical protein
MEIFFGICAVSIMWIFMTWFFTWAITRWILP